jgi:hypothetical protein
LARAEGEQLGYAARVFLRHKPGQLPGHARDQPRSFIVRDPDYCLRWALSGNDISRVSVKQGLHGFKVAVVLAEWIWKPGFLAIDLQRKSQVEELAAVIQRRIEKPEAVESR